jgi:hypothetical protein
MLGCLSFSSVFNSCLLRSHSQTSNESTILDILGFLHQQDGAEEEEVTQEANLQSFFDVETEGLYQPWKARIAFHGPNGSVLS